MNLKVNVKLLANGDPETAVFEKEVFIVHADNHNVDYLLDMIYGSFYSIIDFKVSEEIPMVYISKEYLKMKAVELIHQS